MLISLVPPQCYDVTTKNGPQIFEEERLKTYVDYNKQLMPAKLHLKETRNIRIQDGLCLCQSGLICIKQCRTLEL